jgi:hypothetical protein
MDHEYVEDVGVMVAGGLRVRAVVLFVMKTNADGRLLI